MRGIPAPLTLMHQVSGIRTRNGLASTTTAQSQTQPSSSHGCLAAVAQALLMCECTHQVKQHTASKCPQVTSHQTRHHLHSHSWDASVLERFLRMFISSCWMRAWWSSASGALDEVPGGVPPPVGSCAQQCQYGCMCLSVNMRAKDVIY